MSQLSLHRFQRKLGTMWLLAFLAFCNLMVFYVLVYFILYHVPLAIMLRVPILRSCGVLLSVVNTLSGQCAVPVNVSVIYHVLY